MDSGLKKIGFMLVCPFRFHAKLARLRVLSRGVLALPPAALFVPG